MSLKLPEYEQLLRFAAALILASLTGLYSTKIFREAALKVGVVDRPDTPLKNQKEPVPYFGGLAVFTAFLTAVSITYRLDHDVLGLCFAGTLMLLLGLVDDFGVLTPRVKLLVQVIAVGILVRTGIYIKLEFLPLWVDILLTVIWLVGCANALNIIDVMDGLAAAVSFVIALGIFVFALWCGRTMVAMLALALAGGCLGFLWYNRYPARIYLGDTGSLFIGFMLGALAINNSYTRNNSIAALAPFLLLGVPLFDTAFVSAVRTLRGRSPLHGSPDHYALRLKKRGWSITRIVQVSVAAQVALVIAAVAMSLGGFWVAAATVLGVVAVVIAAALWLSRIEMPYPPDL